MKFDKSNGSQVEKLPIDEGDKDPLEAIQDLSIGKIRPTEVKETPIQRAAIQTVFNPFPRRHFKLSPSECGR